mgnify:CR=1 FL=1
MLEGPRMASSIICWLTGPQYANLICYAFVWIAMLYHLLVCSFIPISGWPCYIIFWFTNLYLCLVCKFIPISVIKYYTYFCYGYFCFFQIWFQTWGEFFSGVRFKTHRNRPPNSQVKTCAFQNAPVRLPLKNSPLLYLFLVCYFIPTSVISNSGLFNFTGYGIILSSAPPYFLGPGWTEHEILSFGGFRVR